MSGLAGWPEPALTGTGRQKPVVPKGRTPFRAASARATHK